MIPAEATAIDAATVTLNPAIDRTITVAGFSRGAVNRAEFVGDRAGGKGVNVASALAEQGHRVAALGFLGRDNDAIFAAHFAGLGVDDRCRRLPGATRTGLKIVDSTRGETTDLNFPGLAPAPADTEAVLRQLDALAAPWGVLAGSLPPGVPADFYAQAIRRLHARGVRVALDTSGAALDAALAAGPDIIKPNTHELEALVGRALPDETAVIEAAKTIVAANGVRLVAVSRGAAGAVFVTAEQVVAARPPTIEVRSTVGAGDAMVAGLVAARLRGLSLAETARLATAYSLHALTRHEGRDPRAALRFFAPRVEV